MIVRFRPMVSLCALAMSVVMMGAQTASAQVKLELKFPEGTKSSTQTEQTVNQTLTLAGQDIVTKATNFIISSSTIGKVSNEGTLGIVDKVESMQAELETAGFKLAFDSANPDKKADLPQLEPLLDAYRSMSKLPVTRTFDTKAKKLKSVSLPEGELEKLGEGVKDRFDPEKMKKATEQAAGFLPDGEVKPGDKWERSSEANFGAGQLMGFRTNYQYIGTVDQDGRKLDKIEGAVFEVSFSIVGNPMLQVTKSDLKVKESKETYLFDREQGHVVSKTSKIRIDGPLTLVIGGNELPGKVDLTIEDKVTRQK